MNNKNAKKERERFYLEDFLAATGWNARILRAGQDDGYDPDFFIELNGMEFGIEMTQLPKDLKRPSGNENVMALKKGFYGNRLIRPGEYFHLPDEEHFSKKWMKWKKTAPATSSTKVVSNDMAREGRHNKFLRSLAEEYYMIAGCPIMLTLSFKNPNEFVRNTCIAKFAGLIKEKASALSQNGTDEFELDEEINARIRRLPDNEESKKYGWKIVNDSVGWSKPINAAMLEDLLFSKYEKLEGYRIRVDRVIALIYTDLCKNSGLMRLEAPPPKVELKGFEAIYLYLHGTSPKEKKYWSIGH